MTELAQVFNSPFEVGLRTLCALTAGHPREFDIQQLLAFDHVMVHSGDMPGGPPSLHPQVQQRNGELLVRRPLVQAGLALMEAKGLVLTRAHDGQIVYASSELATIFLESLNNAYLQSLIERAEWAVSKFGELGNNSFFDVFNMAFDRWSAEFHIIDINLGQV